MEVLQKILSPQTENINDTIIAETILTDMSDVEILELIRKIDPTLMIQDLSTGENIARDPLGANVEPRWVLGPYSPTSISDPKRVGRLDISMKLY